MGMIQNDWLNVLSAEFRKPYYAKLFQFVKDELQYNGKVNLLSNLLEEEKFTVEINKIFNKNWYTYMEHNFDAEVFLHIPKTYHREEILSAYLAHLSILLMIIDVRAKIYYNQ